MFDPVAMYRTQARHSDPPPEAVFNSQLTEFIRARRRTTEEWLLFDAHTPVGRGSMDCRACGERWPCRAIFGLAARWSDDPEYRPEWRIEG